MTLIQTALLLLATLTIAHADGGIISMIATVSMNYVIMIINSSSAKFAK